MTLKEFSLRVCLVMLSVAFVGVLVGFLSGCSTPPKHIRRFPADMCDHRAEDGSCVKTMDLEKK